MPGEFQQIALCCLNFPGRFWVQGEPTSLFPCALRPSHWQSTAWQPLKASWSECLIYSDPVLLPYGWLCKEKNNTIKRSNSWLLNIKGIVQRYWWSNSLIGFTNICKSWFNLSSDFSCLTNLILLMDVCWLFDQE